MLEDGNKVLWCNMGLIGKPELMTIEHKTPFIRIGSGQRILVLCTTPRGRSGSGQAHEFCTPLIICTSGSKDL
jgi:hypothetical protein